MKSLLVFLLCLPLVALGQSMAIGNSAVVGGAAILSAPAETPITYILSDDFEETDTGGALGTSTDGYDDTQAAFESGTVLPDWGGALVGSQSLQTTNGGYMRHHLTSTQAEVDVFFLLKIEQLPASLWFPLAIRKADNTVVGYVYVETDGGLRAYNGTTASSGTVANIATGTTNAIWYHWKNDGTASLGWATYYNGDYSTARPTSAGNYYTSVTGGNGGTDPVGQFYWASRTTASVNNSSVFDHVRATAGALIGNTP